MYVVALLRRVRKTILNYNSNLRLLKSVCVFCLMCVSEGLCAGVSLRDRFVFCVWDRTHTCSCAMVLTEHNLSCWSVLLDLTRDWGYLCFVVRFARLADQWFSRDCPMFASCLCRCAGITVLLCLLYMGSGYGNSGPYVWVASNFPSEPSPHTD